MWTVVVVIEGDFKWCYIDTILNHSLDKNLVFKLIRKLYFYFNKTSVAPRLVNERVLVVWVFPMNIQYFLVFIGIILTEMVLLTCYCFKIYLKFETID